MGVILIFGAASTTYYFKNAFFDAPAPVTPHAITGQATITDGDTIKINGQRIRLHGIDAPESRQLCAADDRQYPCGQLATDALKQLIGNRQVSCTQKDVDQYQRIVAVCYARGTDLNAGMVSQGWRWHTGNFPSTTFPKRKTRRPHGVACGKVSLRRRGTGDDQSDDAVS